MGNCENIIYLLYTIIFKCIPVHRNCIYMIHSIKYIVCEIHITHMGLQSKKYIEHDCI